MVKLRRVLLRTKSSQGGCAAGPVHVRVPGLEWKKANIQLEIHPKESLRPICENEMPNSSRWLRKHFHRLGKLGKKPGQTPRNMEASIGFPYRMGGSSDGSCVTTTEYGPVCRIVEHLVAKRRTRYLLAIHQVIF